MEVDYLFASENSLADRPFPEASNNNQPKNTMRLKVTVLEQSYADSGEMLRALGIAREQIAKPDVATDAGVSGRFIAQDDDPGQGIVVWCGDTRQAQAVGTRHLKKGDKVVWFDPSLPQT